MVRLRNIPKRVHSFLQALVVKWNSYKQERAARKALENAVENTAWWIRHQGFDSRNAEHKNLQGLLTYEEISRYSHSKTLRVDKYTLCVTTMIRGTLVELHAAAPGTSDERLVAMWADLTTKLGSVGITAHDVTVNDTEALVDFYERVKEF